LISVVQHLRRRDNSSSAKYEYYGIMMPL